MKKTITNVVRYALVSLFSFLFIGSALAVEPVAVWDRDFSELTKNGYTLTLGEGNTVSADNSTITIGETATTGVKVAGGTIFTIVVKARNYTPSQATNPEVIVSMLNGDNTLLGIGAKNDGKCWYIWDNKAWGNTHVSSSNQLFVNKDSHVYTLSYSYGASGQITQGTTMNIDGTKIAGEGGLRGGGLGAQASSAVIGGPISSQNLAMAKGLEIEGIAIFADNTVSTADAAAFAWPSVAKLYKPFMDNFSNRIMTITSAGNAGDGKDMGSNNSTFALFNPSIGANTTTTFVGATNTSNLPGYSGSTAAWHGFCHGQSGYVAPGLVMRFPEYVSGRSITVGGGFTPLSVGGLIVEEGASSGTTIPSWTQTAGDRNTEIGDQRASGGVPTYFILRDDFKIVRRNGWVKLFGDITFDIASGKTFDCNTSYSATEKSLQSGAIFRMVGEGTFKVNTLTATGSVTLDYSAQSLSRATQFITGNLTIDASTKFILPDGLAENTDFQLCSGTLTGATSGTHEITVGEATKFATLTFTDNKVQYAWITEKSEVTLSANKTWEEVTQIEGYKGTLPTTINLGADVEIDFAATATTPILTFKGAHKATLVYTKTPTIPEIRVEDGATYAVKITAESDYAAQGLPAGLPELITVKDVGYNFGANAFTYTYTGTDEITPAISGTGAFTKGGTGTIVLQDAFNPASITIAEGALKRPAGSTWSFNQKSITVNNGAKLIMNGGYDKQIDYVIAGNGPAIVQDVVGGDDNKVNGRTLTLTADATFETDADYYFIHSNFDANTINLDSYTLTKTGDAKFYLANTTINGTGTFKIAAGTLDMASTGNLPNGTLELDGGNLNLSHAFTLKNLTVKNGAITGDGALTLTGAFKIAGATVDFSSRALPLTGTLAADSTGTLKITKPTKPTKIIAGTAIPAGLAIVDENGAAIAPLCVYDGYICYGNAASGEYTLTNEDTDAIKALPAGGIYYPLVIGATSIAGTPDGYLAWTENGFAYVAQKSNSISLKTGARTIKDNNNQPWATSILSTDESVGGFPVAGKFWNNTKISNGNQAEVKDYMLLTDGNGVPTEVSVAYRAHNTYYAKYSNAMISGNMRLTGSYLDDNQESKDTQWTISESSQEGVTIPGGSITLPKAPNARGWQFEVSNIPYEMYDLYVYIASDVEDNADNANKHLYACPVVISCDGENWTYYAGPSTATDSDSWEAYGWAHAGNVVEGKNYIRFRISKNSTGLDDISTIHITHGTRNTGANKRLGLAGIQIVEIDDDGMRDRKVVAGDTQKWHDAKSWVLTKQDGTTVDNDWVDSTSSNPITARIDASTIPTIVMDSDAVVDKLVITGAAETFTIAGEAALTATTINATDFTGIIVFDAPVTGALSLGENAKLVVEVGESEEVAVEDLLPEGLTIASGTITVIGAGTVIADGALPTAYQPSFQANTWTGTLYLKNIDWQNFDFGAYGYLGSKIKVTGITGFGPSSTDAGANPEIILEDIAAADPDPAVKAILINNGFSDKAYFFNKVSGSGTFGWDPSVTQGPGSGHTYIFKDVSNFDGVFDTGAFLKIVVGNTTAQGNRGSMTFADGITVKANLGWTAQKAYFGETLTVKGAVGDTLVSGLTAAPTLNTVVTLKDAQGETVAGEYALAYDSDEQIVKIVRVVTVTIPEVAGATASVEGYTITDNKIVVPYNSTFTLVYTANEGKLFSDGKETKSFDFPDVTTAPTIDVSTIETTAALPTATVEQMDPIPDGLDDAATFTAGEESKLYSDWNADFVFSATESFAKESITLKGMVEETWIDLPFAADYTAGEKISVLGMIPNIGDWKVTYPMLVQMGTFSCGLAKNSLAKPMTVTIDLVLTKEGEDPMTLATYTVDIEEDKATITGAAVDYLFGSYIAYGPEGEEEYEYFNDDYIAKVPYGAENVVVYYQVEDGYAFSTGSYVYEIELGTVTEDKEAKVPAEVTVGAVVAQIAGETPFDTKFYPSLASAVAAAQDGETITMTGNDSLEATIAKSVTVNVNGKSVNVAITAGEGVTVNLAKGGTVAGTVTVDGGTVNFSDANDGVAGNFTGTLNYISGTVTKSSNYTVPAPEGYEWKEGTLTAIYPIAKVEATTIDGFDAAYIYTAMNDAPVYDAAIASFVFTSNKAIPADAVKIGGKFATMDWNIYNLPACEANTEYKITEATWSQVKAISPFTCGAASIALTEDTEVTLTLKLGDEVIDTKTVTLKAIADNPWADAEGNIPDVTPENKEAVETTLAAIQDALGDGATVANVGEWIKTVYGDNTAVPAATVAAAKNVGISVKYNLPLMTAPTPTIEIAKDVEGDGFTFQIKDGDDPVSLAAAESKIQSMVQFTADLKTAFGESTATDVEVDVSDDNKTAKVTFTKATAAGFMRVNLK